MSRSARRHWPLVAVLSTLAVLTVPANAADGSRRTSHGILVPIPASVRRLYPIGVGSREGPATFGSRAAPAVTWSPAGTMPYPVAGAGGGVYSGGKVYVPGGLYSDTTLLGQMQIYDGTTWTVDDETMPYPEEAGTSGWYLGAVCADQAGKIHVLNGTLDGNSVSASHQVFDPSAPAGSRWSWGPPPVLPTLSAYFVSILSGCAYINGKLYLFGGLGYINYTPPPPEEWTPLAATWEYDPATGVWSDTGMPMTTPRELHAYANSGGFAYVAGGSADNLTYTPTVERFSPASGWASLPDLPVARYAFGMGVAGRMLLVWGGLDAAGQTLGSTLRCRTGCASWTDINQNLATPRSWLAWASGGGKLYAAGGFDDVGTFLNSAESTP